MNASELVTKYDFHDSLIDDIVVNVEESTITMMIDFAFWMQSGYREGDPETGNLQICFQEVAEYECPAELPFGEISILNVGEENGRIHFVILNDMTNDCYDLYIRAKSIAVHTP